MIRHEASQLGASIDGQGSSLYYYVVSLEHFGFTPSEARVYEVLVKLGRSTGYAVAREAGLARANAYQALEGLVRRGAARRSDRRPKAYSALAPQVLLWQLAEETRERLESLGSRLTSLGSESPASTGTADGDFEVIGAAQQLLSHAAQSIAEAHAEVLAVMGPWARSLYSEVQRAAGRVSMRLLCLGEPAPDLATVRRVSERELVGYWGGLPVGVVCDRRAAVFGVLRGQTAAGVSTTHDGLVPFLRHLLRRELAAPGDRG